MKQLATIPKWRVWPNRGGHSLGVVEAQTEAAAVELARQKFGDLIVVVPTFSGAAVTP